MPIWNRDWCSLCWLLAFDRYVTILRSACRNTIAFLLKFFFSRNSHFKNPALSFVQTPSISNGFPQFHWKKNNDLSDEIAMNKGFVCSTATTKCAQGRKWWLLALAHKFILHTICIVFTTEFQTIERARNANMMSRKISIWFRNENCSSCELECSAKNCRRKKRIESTVWHSSHSIFSLNSNVWITKLTFSAIASNPLASRHSQIWNGFCFDRSSLMYAAVSEKILEFFKIVRVFFFSIFPTQYFAFV